MLDHQFLNHGCAHDNWRRTRGAAFRGENQAIEQEEIMIAYTEQQVDLNGDSETAEDLAELSKELIHVLQFMQYRSKPIFLIALLFCALTTNFLLMLSLL